MMFTMLEAVELPASIADLAASLADVNADTFPLKKNIKKHFPRGNIIRNIVKSFGILTAHTPENKI